MTRPPLGLGSQTGCGFFDGTLERVGLCFLRYTQIGTLSKHAAFPFGLPGKKKKKKKTWYQLQKDTPTNGGLPLVPSKPNPNVPFAGKGNKKRRKTKKSAGSLMFFLGNQ